mgnify:CR=1 FL=1
MPASPHGMRSLAIDAPTHPIPARRDSSAANVTTNFLLISGQLAFGEPAVNDEDTHFNPSTQRVRSPTICLKTPLRPG